MVGALFGQWQWFKIVKCSIWPRGANYLYDKLPKQPKQKKKQTETNKNKTNKRITNLLVLVPKPQVLEQDDQGDHSVTKQSFLALAAAFQSIFPGVFLSAFLPRLRGKETQNTFIHLLMEFLILMKWYDCIASQEGKSMSIQRIAFTAIWWQLVSNSSNNTCIFFSLEWRVKILFYHFWIRPRVLSERLKWTSGQPIHRPTTHLFTSESVE